MNDDEKLFYRSIMGKYDIYLQCCGDEEKSMLKMIFRDLVDDLCSIINFKIGIDIHSKCLKRLEDLYANDYEVIFELNKEIIETNKDCDERLSNIMTIIKTFEVIVVDFVLVKEGKYEEVVNIDNLFKKIYGGV